MNNPWAARLTFDFARVQYFRLRYMQVYAQFTDLVFYAAPCRLTFFNLQLNSKAGNADLNAAIVGAISSDDRPVIWATDRHPFVGNVKLAGGLLGGSWVMDLNVTNPLTGPPLTGVVSARYLIGVDFDA
jgi:hypothetical protein